MRDVLFRAKELTGQWVVGYYFCMTHHDGRHIHHFIIPLGADLSLGTPIEKIQIEVDPETICQYTGLTDKNGKKIWENDILHKAYHSENDCIIVWNDGRFRFKTIHGEYNQDPMTLLSMCFTQKTVDRLGVIGNIFDNSELLKED